MGLFNRKPKAVKIHSLDELEPMIESGQPVLLDFFQVGCGPCQVMDGIVNELAQEYGESAHVVKVDVTKVAGAAQMFKVRSTPTFVVLGRPPVKRNKKQRRAGTAPAATNSTVAERYRNRGLVKKNELQRALEGNGAVRIEA
jgi:thioredoxin 1